MHSPHKRSIYFIGIGGIGMSGLARYFKANGYAVLGSDSARNDTIDSLRKEGIKVVIGHKPGAIPKSAIFVVYNRAIPADNPELAGARALGVPVVPYATVLGKLTEYYLTVAITGSHGKSTTTALAGLALTNAGLDPTVLVGTNLKEFGGKNIRMGKSPYLVLESDDFGAAFLEYSPAVSIVTNIDREHMDFYKTLSGVKNAFLKFMAKTREGGALILNRDDKNLFSLKARIGTIAKQKRLRVIWYSAQEAAAVKKVITIPGKHNVSNAMAVVELGKLLKLPKEKVLSAIGSYGGAWRRMEFRGMFKTVSGTVSMPVYDDYAHHPTEIKATLQAFREKFPKAPLICVFQPHQAKRLEALFKEFVSAFTETDVLVLLPLYKVAGRDVVTKFTSEYLAAAIVKKYPRKEIYYLENPRHIKKMLTKIIPLLGGKTSSPAPTSAPVILMMGAGDIVQYTGLLIDR